MRVANPARAALNGRRSTGARLRDADETALRQLGRRVTTALLARGASRPTALALARAADAAATAGIALPDIAGDLLLPLSELLAQVAAVVAAQRSDEHEPRGIDR